MRVLYAIDGLWVGGSERSLAEMLPLLPGHQVKARVVCLRQRARGVEDDVRRSGADIAYLQARTTLRRVRELRGILAEYRPDLVHCTLYDASLVARLAAVGTDIPVLNSLVTTSYERARLSEPSIPQWKKLGSWAIDVATARLFVTHFHAVSETVRTSAIRRMGIPDSRITVIPRGRARQRLGRPSPARRSEARAKLGLDDGCPVLLNVGRHEHAKGLPDLVAAAALLRAEFPELRVLVAGRNGKLTDTLVELQEALSLERQVAFLGHRDDVPELLAAADIFVFPSLYEGMPGAVIEAMAAGLPIVGTDIPAMRELLGTGRGARLVPPGSPEDLAGAIRDLLLDPELRARMGERSLHMFDARPSLETSVEHMVALYRRIVGSGRHVRSSTEQPIREGRP